jgi:hypothetical protein
MISTDHLLQHLSAAFEFENPSDHTTTHAISIRTSIAPLRLSGYGMLELGYFLKFQPSTVFDRTILKHWWQQQQHHQFISTR